MSKHLDDLGNRWKAAAHAVQSGIAFLMQIPERADGLVGGKHLRVGVNNALVDQGSLARLLIKKGLISEEEYLEALVEGMEKEAKSWEKDCSDAMGKPVSLL